MPYTITHSDGERVISVADQTVDSSTSIKFIGKNYNGYARDIAENFLHLLENFASVTPPENPTIGQLWYDTDNLSTIQKPQLKVFDGTNFVSATNVFKSVSKPTGARIGDIWIDISRQQLFIYSGISGGIFEQTGASVPAEQATWLLIGPQFSAGSSTGPVADKIPDVNDNFHNIIKFVVGVENGSTITTEVVAILSFSNFTPKASIPGFLNIKSGFNISSTNNNATYWGVAEKANNLVVNQAVVPSTNFLRKDAVNTTDFKLNISNVEGISIGTNLTTSLRNTSTGATVLSNSLGNSSIIFRLSDGANNVDAVTIYRNLLEVSAPMTVEGSISSGAVIISDTTPSSSLNSSVELPDNATGSLKTAGGVGISKNLVVAGSAEIGQQLTSGTIIPRISNLYNLGSTVSKWKEVNAVNVRADNFYGTLNGTFIGSVLGTASSLTSSTSFQLIGEVESDAVQSIGDGTPVTMTTRVTQTIFDNQGPADSDSLLFDQLLINRPGVGLKKITKDKFISNISLVPTGTILPFAGTTTPNGYLPCDGRQISRVDYPVLFTTIGYTYSTVTSGDLFKVPNIPSSIVPGSSYIIFTGKL